MLQSTCWEMFYRLKVFPALMRYGREMYDSLERDFVDY